MSALWVTVPAAAAAAALGIEAIRRLGGRVLLDRPNERSSHTRPTPRGGGLGVIVPTLAGWLVTDGRGGAVGVIGLATACVAAISWFDDRRGVPFAGRLACHVGAAALAIWVLGPVREVALPMLGAISPGPFAWTVSVLWIVGLTNAYNFMDGIDGIAGGQGLVAGAAWWLIGWRFGIPAVAALGALLAATCFVFLLFNWSPARIFLGDVGSAPLGFLFAVVPLLAAKFRPDAAPELSVAGLAAVWPFVFDTGFTFLARLRRRENVFAAHRSHLYQRMVIAGWSHAGTALLYLGLAAVSASAGLGIVAAGRWSFAAVLAAVLVPVVLLTLTRRLERRA